ncbi:hypothetical protein CEXT_131331 [Caerostris extrusa]|uniref:Uncharacterized protein n=1 Tax=Caerostris extrusa TaxID=172846 RepID=A0AAV4UB15_CAEEX|nr:hypothetical protein CEXT_131331 [Caerostris extrusa]
MVVFTCRLHGRTVCSGQPKYSLKLSFSESILGVKIGALQSEVREYVSSLHSRQICGSRVLIADRSVDLVY